MDIKAIWQPARGAADWALVGADLETDEDLVTAVTLSLFTDRLAAPGDPLPPGVEDRRGWWGDSFADVAGDLIGSRLWLLARAKSTDGLLLTARGYILEALHWLIEDGVAARVDAATWWLPGGSRSKMGARTEIRRTNGRVVASQYEWAWKELAA